MLKTQSDIIFLHNVDSYALLATPTNGDKCDVILTDPPYEEHIQINMLSTNKFDTSKTYKVNAGFEHLDSYSWVSCAMQHVKRWAIFFCGLEQMGYYRDASDGMWIRSGVYMKTRAVPQLTGDRPGCRAEGMSILHAKDTKKRWNGKGTHAFWEVPDESPSWWGTPESRQKTRHPTSKPLMLCMRLVELFSDPGEVLFDPFCGTGNIGIAAMLLGRRYVGLDNNQEHISCAIERANIAQSQASMLLDKFSNWKNKS